MKELSSVFYLSGPHFASRSFPYLVPSWVNSRCYSLVSIIFFITFCMIKIWGYLPFLAMHFELYFFMTGGSISDKEALSKVEGKFIWYFHVLLNFMLPVLFYKLNMVFKYIVACGIVLFVNSYLMVSVIESLTVDCYFYKLAYMFYIQDLWNSIMHIWPFLKMWEPKSAKPYRNYFSWLYGSKIYWGLIYFLILLLLLFFWLTANLVWILYEFMWNS